MAKRTVKTESTEAQAVQESTEAQGDTVEGTPSTVQIPTQNEGETPEAYLVRLQAFVRSSATQRHSDAIEKMLREYEASNNIRIKTVIWRYAKGEAMVKDAKPGVTVKLFASK